MTINNSLEIITNELSYVAKLPFNTAAIVNEITGSDGRIEQWGHNCVGKARELALRLAGKNIQSYIIGANTSNPLVNHFALIGKIPDLGFFYLEPSETAAEPVCIEDSLKGISQRDPNRPNIGFTAGVNANDQLIIEGRRRKSDKVYGPAFRYLFQNWRLPSPLPNPVSQLYPGRPLFMNLPDFERGRNLRFSLGGNGFSIISNDYSLLYPEDVEARAEVVLGNQCDLTLPQVKEYLSAANRTQNEILRIRGDI